MTDSGLGTVCEEIDRAERRTVVECGSGPSTVALARLLRER